MTICFLLSIMNLLADRGPATQSILVRQMQAEKRASVLAVYNGSFADFGELFHGLSHVHFRSDADCICHRSTLHQHHPYASYGRCPKSEFRAPRDADGDGAGGLLLVATVSAIRSGGSDLAQSRPLRTLDGPRVDAALLLAAPKPGEGRRSGIRDAWKTQ